MIIYRIDAGFDYEGPYLSYLYKDRTKAEAKLDELEDLENPFDWVNSFETKLEDE